MNEWLRGLNRPSSTVLVAGMLVLGAAGGGLLYGEEISNWVGGDPEYELIDFDSNQTRAYAQGLVNLGDPVWGGGFQVLSKKRTPLNPLRPTSQTADFLPLSRSLRSLCTTWEIHSN